jgi:hypothetical protein
MEEEIDWNEEVGEYDANAALTETRAAARSGGCFGGTPTHERT